MKMQIAAIEFGTSKIVTMIARNSGLDRLDIVGSGTVPYDGYTDGNWNTPRQMVQRVRDSIAAAEMEANTKIREIYVGVPGEYVHVFSVEASVDAPNGEITDETINAVQDAAADKLHLSESGCMVLHRSPAWFIVDDGKQTMSPLGGGNKLTAMITFIVADQNFIDDIREMLGVLNITILGFLATTLGETLLTPTRIYVKQVLAMLEAGVRIRAISHITGGGFYENIPRSLAPGKMARIERSVVRIPPVFKLIQEVGGIPERDMFNTFNMGVGMCLTVAAEDVDLALDSLYQVGETDAYVLGEIVDGEDGIALC